MQRYTPNFLKSLELPLCHEAELPTNRFNEALAQWESQRAHELKQSTPPDYLYYMSVYQGHTSAAWRGQDNLFRAEFEDDSRWGFVALGDHPALVLGYIANKLGGRLVPFARWAGLKCRAPELPNYVENHCREWCANADGFYRVSIKEKVTRSNREEMRAGIKPLRAKAEDLERLTACELWSLFD